MRKLNSCILTLLLTVPFVAATPAHSKTFDRATPILQEQEQIERRVLRTPTNNTRPRRVSGDRRQRRGVRNALGKSGRHYARGGKNIAQGTGYAGVAAGRTGKRVATGTATTARTGARGTKRVATTGARGTKETAKAGARGTCAVARGTGRTVRRVVNR